MSRPNGSSAMPHQAQDIEHIQQIIATIEQGFNTNDVEASVRHFTEDATVVNAVGTHLSGFAAIVAAHERGYAGFLRHEHARYDVIDIVFLRPDIALAYVRGLPTTPQGDVVEGQGMIALYVMIEREARWWVAAHQNTLVVA